MASFVDQQRDRMKRCLWGLTGRSEDHSLQHGHLVLESTQDLSKDLDVSQQVTGVRNLGGVDLRVVLLHTGQAEHLARNQQVRF